MRSHKIRSKNCHENLDDRILKTEVSYMKRVLLCYHNLLGMGLDGATSKVICSFLMRIKWKSSKSKHSKSSNIELNMKLYLLLVSTFVAMLAGIAGGGLAGDQAYFGSWNIRCNFKLKIGRNNFRMHRKKKYQNWIKFQNSVRMK